jgi:hypothetical protein
MSRVNLNLLGPRELGGFLVRQSPSGTEGIAISLMLVVFGLLTPVLSLALDAI